MQEEAFLKAILGSDFLLVKVIFTISVLTPHPFFAWPQEADFPP
jgi:hypothetical protein